MPSDDIFVSCRMWDVFPNPLAECLFVMRGTFIWVECPFKSLACIAAIFQSGATVTSQVAPAWQGWVEQGAGWILHTVSELGMSPGLQAQSPDTHVEPSTWQDPGPGTQVYMKKMCNQTCNFRLAGWACKYVSYLSDWPKATGWVSVYVATWTRCSKRAGWVSVYVAYLDKLIQGCWLGECACSYQSWATRAMKRWSDAMKR